MAKDNKVLGRFQLVSQSHSDSRDTVDSGYQAHALVGTIAKIYALHNEVRHIARVKG